MIVQERLRYIIKKVLTGAYHGGSSKRLTWSSGLSNLPAIAWGAGTHIHVTWHDGSFGDPEIFYRRSTNSGSSWDGTKRITWNSGGSIAPPIVVWLNYVHLTWCDGTPGNADIFYRGSTNNGSSWGGARRITWTTKDSFYPRSCGRFQQSYP